MLWRLIFFIFLGCLVRPTFATESIGVAAPGDNGQTELDRLVQDVCNKEIVLLGGDNHHGSGGTFDIKTKLVRRLIEHCGFGGVLFESSFYEFVHYSHLVSEGAVTPKKTVDAIGALWTIGDESRPLMQYLFREVTSDHLRIGGLDPQMGSSTGYYEQQQLAGDLVRYLPEGSERKLCLTLFTRQDNWLYDDAHPFDAAAKVNLGHPSSAFEA